MRLSHGFSLISATGLAAGLTFTACNMDQIKGGKGRGEGDAEATHVSNFAGKGELCGTFVSFYGYTAAARSDLGKPASLVVQLGVCGKMNNADWKALAVTHATPQVSVAQARESGKSEVYIDDKAVVARRPDGKAFTVGRLARDDKGHPVVLDDGVKVQVLVDGEPFSLEQSKPGGAKSVLVTLP